MSIIIAKMNLLKSTYYDGDPLSSIYLFLFELIFIQFKLISNYNTYKNISFD